MAFIVPIFAKIRKYSVVDFPITEFQPNTMKW